MLPFLLIVGWNFWISLQPQIYVNGDATYWSKFPICTELSWLECTLSSSMGGWGPRRSNSLLIFPFGNAFYNMANFCCEVSLLNWSSAFSSSVGPLAGVTFSFRFNLGFLAVLDELLTDLSAVLAVLTVFVSMCCSFIWSSPIRGIS